MIELDKLTTNSLIKNDENKSKYNNIFDSDISSIGINVGNINLLLKLILVKINENAEISFHSKEKNNEKNLNKEVVEEQSSITKYLPWFLISVGALVTSYILYRKFK